MVGVSRETDGKVLRARGMAEFLDNFLPILRAAIDRVTAKEAAFLFDVKGSYLADALAPRDERYSRIEWLVILLVAAPDPVRAELLAELCRIGGYKKPERRRKKNDAEENEAYKRAIAKFAPGLVDLIEREVDDS